MTLDEAIKHAEEVAEDAKLISMMVGISHITELEQKKCAEEHRQLAEWLKELKRLKEAATDTDTIRRQAAIEAIASRDETNGTVKVFTGRQVNEILESLPSADRPSGHWVLINRGLDIYMCDQCGEILQIDRVPIWDYCPICGERMVREDGEEE